MPSPRPILISASYKTDIPAFYGCWFLNRLRAGYCRVRNPYSSATYRVSLRREDVAGFIFWTKNVQPFLAVLAEVHERSFPFVVQFGINDYPRALELAVTNARRSIGNAQRLAGTYGPRCVVWRYDTIVTSSITPLEDHLMRFERLARALRGSTDECVISFAQAYRKTARRLDAAAAAGGFTWMDPEDEQKRRLAEQLADIAAANGMALTLCGQRHLLVPGVGDARCIDPVRMADVAGQPIEVRAKGHRSDCGCCASRDIGAYNSCPHGCAYCYAVSSDSRARAVRRAHNPDSEYLVDPTPSTACAPAVPASTPAPTNHPTTAPTR